MTNQKAQERNLLVKVRENLAMALGQEVIHVQVTEKRAIGEGFRVLISHMGKGIEGRVVL